jgi:hypothetical protein
MRNLQIKTLLEKDTAFNFPGFLMHVTAVFDAIKKCGHFKDYEKAERAYVEAKQEVKSAKTGLNLINGSSKGSGKLPKAKKAEVKAEEARTKAKEAKAKPNKAEGATKVPKDPMKASFQADLEKAKNAVEDAQGAMITAANEMFTFYSNLLSPESKYLWNKIVSKQMESNPFVNLQCVSLESPRGMSCKLFDNCVMFHLLTVFPINAAEQEKYYITSVLKKPQHVNVRQFVCRVEQLNAHITQIPCFYFSSNANASTKPENVPFTEA